MTCLRWLGLCLARLGSLQRHPETDLATLVMLNNTMLLRLRILDTPANKGHSKVGIGEALAMLIRNSTILFPLRFLGMMTTSQGCTEASAWTT